MYRRECCPTTPMAPLVPITTSLPTFGTLGSFPSGKVHVHTTLVLLSTLVQQGPQEQRVRKVVHVVPLWMCSWFREFQQLAV